MKKAGRRLKADGALLGAAAEKIRMGGAFTEDDLAEFYSGDRPNVGCGDRPDVGKPGEPEEVDCISFYLDKGGHRRCSALMRAYCLIESKPCAFRITAAMAAEGRVARLNARVCEGRP